MICAAGVSAATIMDFNFRSTATIVLGLFGILVSFGPAVGQGSKSEIGGRAIVIDAATAQNLGIKVALVQSQKLAGEIVVAGHIELLPSQKIEISPPSKGKILQLLVQSGTKVKAGQAVAKISSPQLKTARLTIPEQKNEHGINLQQAQTELRLAQENYRRIDQIAQVDREQALRQLTTAQNRLSRERQSAKSRALLQAKTNYQRQQQISRAEISAAQQAVSSAAERYRADLRSETDRIGTQRQTLASKIRLAESHVVLAKALNQSGLVQAETALRNAESEAPRGDLPVAEEQVARAKEQLAKARNQRSVIEADSQLRKAKSAVLAAQNRQSLHTATYNANNAQLESSDQQHDVTTLKSSIDGTVTIHVATFPDATGQVEAGSKIMTVTKAQQVLALANIDEQDLARVKIGQKTNVKTGNEVLVGIVSQIGTAIDGQSQVIPIRVAISNGGEFLQSGISAELQLVTDESATPVLVVPSASIIEAQGKKLVYVQNGATYQAVAIDIGRTVDDVVEVKTGLLAGDRIVTQQARQIYTQALNSPTYKQNTAKAPVANWPTPSPWWLVAPGTLITGATAWWLVTKRDQANIDDFIQAEIMTEDPDLATTNGYDFDAEILPPDTQIDVTDVEEIIENGRQRS
jgi:membrane fusion protein, heavy metal efflux system